MELLSEYEEISEELKDKILAEEELDVLTEWAKLAARVDSVEEFARNYVSPENLNHTPNSY